MNRLRELRTAAGLSQGQLAKRLGIQGAHIGQIENGRRLPSHKVTLKLLDVLDCGFRDLFPRAIDIPAIAKTPDSAPGSDRDGATMDSTVTGEKIDPGANEGLNSESHSPRYGLAGDPSGFSTTGPRS